MSNDELIRCFENGVLPGESFHHADHVQLAFAYLREYPVLHALEKFAGALKRFAAGRGKSELYNENHHLRLFLFDPRTDGTLRGCELGRIR